MLSPADRPRLELLLRGAALATLFWLTVEAFANRSTGTSARLTTPLAEGALASWTVAPPADTLTLRLGAAPAPLIRDWLVALRRAGTGVRWTDEGIPSLVVEAERRPDPAGAVIVRISGPAGVSVRVGDDLDAGDSLILGSLGASLRLPVVAGAVRVSVGSSERGVVATARPAPFAHRRHLVLVGAAGWESKFVVAALEERGWEVDARLVVAPGLAVTQGSPFPLDTARVAAIIALDSTAASFALAIARFVHTGGGALLGPDATRRAALQDLAPGGGGVVLRPTLTAGVSMSRERLGLHDLAPLVADALPLERRGDHVTVAVRRVGAGRVGQIGYLESWRWRMDGGPEGVGRHRDWWAALVASVAYSGGAISDAAGDPAPRAALFHALGAPSLPVSHSQRDVYPLVLGVLLVCLFGEWTSRRLRGEK